MANENHASYGIIGFTVLIGVAAVLATLVYVGGLRGRGDVIYAETYYDKPVSGLSVGSAVNFRGVKIGEVREISFVGCKYDIPDTDRESNGRIYILMALKVGNLDYATLDGNAIDKARKILKWWISQGLRATVTSNGITGLSRVEFNLIGPDAAPSDKPLSWHPETLYIPSEMSLLDNFSEAATKIMNQINRMDFAPVWSNLTAAVESLSEMSAGANRLLTARQPEVERMSRELQEAASSLNRFAERISDNPSLILRGVETEPLPETK